MDPSTVAQRLMASSLSLLLVSCSATGFVPAPSGSADLSRYVLVIQEGPEGQLSHSWRPLSSVDVSKYPYHTSNSSRFEGEIVRASFNRDCEAERDECEKTCKASLKGRNWTHASDGSKDEMCRGRCRPAYLDCCKLKELAEASKLRLSFPVVDSAVDWLKQHHRELAVGTVVVIAGVAFVVVVAGSGGGALVLAPAVLLVSSGASSAHVFNRVEQ